MMEAKFLVENLIEKIDAAMDKKKASIIQDYIMNSYFFKEVEETRRFPILGFRYYKRFLVPAPLTNDLTEAEQLFATFLYSNNNVATLKSLGFEDGSEILLSMNLYFFSQDLEKYKRMKKMKNFCLSVDAQYIDVDEGDLEVLGQNL